MLISQGEGKGEMVVATLSEGGFFGERALLENKPRAASIRCKKTARTMAITRDQFEAALGAPLKELLPRLQEGCPCAHASSRRLALFSCHHAFALSFSRRPPNSSQFCHAPIHAPIHARSQSKCPSRLPLPPRSQESAQIRELVDKDADQQLDFEEFRQLVKIKEKNRKYTEEQLHEYFNSLDLDGSGTVDLNEYDKYRLQDAMAARERTGRSS